MHKNRREVLGMAGCAVTVAGVVGAGTFRIADAKSSPEQPGKRAPVKLDAKGKVIHDPLPYVALDPQEAQARAYANKLIGDCQYGVFATIIEMLAEKIGGPYLTYPITVTRVGAGGTLGWAGTCGALLGASELIYLVSPDPGPVIDDVFNYYQYTSLPDQKPTTAKEDIVPSIADSILCHASISHWTKVSGEKTFSAIRARRCAQLAGVIARRTVEDLNAQLAGNFKATAHIPAAVTACRACHDIGGKVENTRGKQDCFACHNGHDTAKPSLQERIGKKTGT